LNHRRAGHFAKGVGHALRNGYSTPATKTLDEHSIRTLDHELELTSFHIALHRRLAYAPHSPVKSAFYVTSPATVHYSKLHKLLNDYSPINVRLFTELAEAAKWLDVPMKVLTMHF
jgi:hypothetical protein